MGKNKKIIQTMDKSMNKHSSSSFVEDSFMLEFMEMMQRNVAELIKEFSQVVCAVYQMHIIGKMTTKEIAEELDAKESFIDMYVKYYDLLLS